MNGTTSTALEVFDSAWETASSSAGGLYYATPMRSPGRLRTRFSRAGFINRPPESSAASQGVDPGDLTGWLIYAGQRLRRWPASVSGSRTATPAPVTLSDAQTGFDAFDADSVQGLQTMFREAREYRFEDGMESPFSAELSALVEHDGNRAVQALAGLLIGELIDAEVAAEALRWLGLINDPETADTRRWLLERCLWLSSARVRDGALLGLAFMDEADSLPSLMRAMQREVVPELRDDMQQVIAQLEDMRRCHSS
jgi:hypothetical protein